MRFNSSFVAVAALLSSTTHSKSTRKLFSGGTIVAWDDATNLPKVIRDGFLLVKDDRIVTISDSKPEDVSDDTEIIDVTDQIITPGFVDTHRHSWQTGLKTIASNTTLAEYFNRYGEFAAAPHFTADDIYWGELTGLYESLNAGVTTTLDHAHHTWSNATAYAGLNATIKSGARVFWAYAFHDIPSLNYTMQDQLPNFEEIARSKIVDGTNVEVGIAYDFWGPNPPPFTTKVAKLARDFNVSVITSHSLGGPWGNDNLPEDIDAFNMLNTSIPVVLSHGSFMTARGANLLRKHNQYLSITPESEMHYGHTHPHSHLYQDQASLGVDTHFTYSIDVLTQARIWMQSVRYYYANEMLSEWQLPANNMMSVNQAFSLATRAGGLALRRPDIGVIQEGAKADLIVWNAAESPSLLGWVDPVAAVMLHASVGDILHVTVNGEFVKRDGKLTAPDYKETRQQFLGSAARVKKIYKELAYPVLDGEFNDSGFDVAPKKIVDAQRGEGDGYGSQFL